MVYDVKLSRRAERDLYELYEFLDTSHSPSARRWFNRLEEAIYNLERSPRRCPSAHEAQKIERPLRHFLFGNKPHIYRVLFEINELTGVVLVLTIRHGARDEWKPRKTSRRRD
jgi:plasmid stabilization system protein ParE